jgi:excisionase family DNA binding protein
MVRPGTAEINLTVKEAAAWFRVAPSTVREWVRQRKIECRGTKGPAKLYRFSDLIEAERATRNATTQPGRKR